MLRNTLASRRLVAIWWLQGHVVDPAGPVGLRAVAMREGFGSIAGGNGEFD